MAKGFDKELTFIAILISREFEVGSCGDEIG